MNNAGLGPLGTQLITDAASHGVQITELATTQDQLNAIGVPQIGIQAAVDAARLNLGQDASTPTDATALARVTTDQYGTEQEPDPTKPSRIAPAIANRTVWVVSFPAAKMPILGKAGYTGPKYATGPAIALVDPVSGEFLYGISF